MAQLEVELSVVNGQPIMEIKSTAETASGAEKAAAVKLIKGLAAADGMPPMSKASAN